MYDFIGLIEHTLALESTLYTDVCRDLTCVLTSPLRDVHVPCPPKCATQKQFSSRRYCTVREHRSKTPKSTRSLLQLRKHVLPPDSITPRLGAYHSRSGDSSNYSSSPHHPGGKRSQEATVSGVKTAGREAIRKWGCATARAPRASAYRRVVSVRS